MITELDAARGGAESHGLEFERLRGLGQIVVVSGPNGSGKSRLLRLVAEKSVEHLSLLERRKSVKGGDQKRALRDALNAMSFRGEAARAIALPTGLVANTKVHNPDALTPQQVTATINEAKTKAPTLTDIYRAFHVYLHRAVTLDITGRENAEVAHARKFLNLAGALLGERPDVGFAQDGLPFPTLFGRRVEPGELSLGQRTLLCWAILIAEQPAGLTKSPILLIDEPENHLHPSVCVDVLDRLVEGVLGDDGQLWLATHSPAIVAHFGYECVYRSERGRITYAGSRTDQIMDGLLGGHDGREKLATFFQSIDEHNFLRFAMQSLFQPDVAGARDGDAQGSQFHDVVRERLRGGNQLTILDCAAGKGRFASLLASELAPDVAKRLDYIAYNDPMFDDHAEECSRNVAKLPMARSTGDVNDVADATVDVVVLCNALHEIPPVDWATMFAWHARVLRSSGSLLIMEDQLPAVGELPHLSGYLVLGVEELRELFCSRDGVEEVSSERDGRLTAVAVRQSVLTHCTAESISAALAALAERMKHQLLALRTNSNALPKHRLGRHHAFTALQLANAYLAQDTIRE